MPCAGKYGTETTLKEPVAAAFHNDDSTGRSDRTLTPWAPGALGLLQHLLHPGPRAAADGGSGDSRVRLQGRNPDEYWALTHRILEWGDAARRTLILDAAVMPPDLVVARN